MDHSFEATACAEHFLHRGAHLHAHFFQTLDRWPNFNRVESTACWHTHNRRADFIIDLNQKVFSRRIPAHPQGEERCSLTRSCEKVDEFVVRMPFQSEPGFRLVS
jgi:hypothetical protein